jgi:protein transport protein SEC13
MGWKEEHCLRAHGDWVRDVCWSVNMGLPMNTIGGDPVPVKSS